MALEGDDARAVPFLLGPYAALLVLCLLTGCSTPGAPGVLASWKGGEITVEQLDQRVRELPAEQRRPAGGQSVGEWVAARAADLALTRILLERARDGSAALSAPLALRARFEASQQIGREHLATLCPEPSISEADLAAAFERDNPGQPRPWILVRHIYKRSLPGAPAAERAGVRAEMTRLVAQLDAGVSFIELARLESDSETAPDGGLIGRISRQAPIEPRVRDAAWALSDGERSGVIEVANGFHVVLRERSGVEEPPTFEQARHELAHRQALNRREACAREVLRGLGAKTAVFLDRDALAARDNASRIALTIGEETFTVGELSGLSAEFVPLAECPNPGELVRKFSESVLLVADARESDAASVESYAQILVRSIDRELVDAEWRDQRIATVLARPEAELRSYFEASADRFRTDLELDLGLILISSSDGGRRAALEEAYSLYRRISAGESFARLAEERSEHVSREVEGRLGSLPLPRLRVVLGSRGIAAASKLAEGEVSEPVKIHDPPAAAFGILKLYARTEPRPRSFEEAREDVIVTLAGERVRQLDLEVRQRLLDASSFVVHQQAVEAYLADLDG
jgi:peptidyl-prolyl cis-trans isomerase C